MPIEMKLIFSFPQNLTTTILLSDSMCYYFSYLI